jgi:hypothetical protein
MKDWKMDGHSDRNEFRKMPPKLNECVHILPGYWAPEKLG